MGLFAQNTLPRHCDFEDLFNFLDLSLSLNLDLARDHLALLLLLTKLFSRSEPSDCLQVLSKEGNNTDLEPLRIFEWPIKRQINIRVKGRFVITNWHDLYHKVNYASLRIGNL